MATTLPKPAKPGVAAPKRRRRGNFSQAMDSLKEFCADLQPGDLVPTHSELMSRFDVSERAMLKALDELQRSGKIVRRRGKGTFVTDRNGITELDQPIVPSAVMDTKTIVAILRPEHAYFKQCLQLLFLQAKVEDLNVACRLIDQRSEWSGQHLAEAGQTAGFIVFSGSLEPVARQIQEAGHRVVLLAGPQPDEIPQVPSVYSDHEQGGFMAVSHLLELGHRRLLFPGYMKLDQGLRGHGHQRAIKNWNARIEAREARGDLNRPDEAVQPMFITSQEMNSWESDPGAAAAFFNRPGAPTAVVVWNDQEALRCLRSLNRAGVAVPEQVSLVGYDALPEGAMVHPSLTTVNTQIELQLQSALTILMRSVAPPPSHSVVVVPSLVVRDSTAPPAIA